MYFDGVKYVWTNSVLESLLMTVNIKEFLITRSLAHGVDLSILESLEENSDALPSLLEAAIDLRGRGEFENSLLLLDWAVEAGLSSPWIEENRARAFVHLDRYFEAVAIWDKLSQLDDDALKTASIQMAELHRQKLSDLELDVLASSEVSSELKDRLDNAIALRKSGDLEAALEQLSVCKKEGYHSPWISDNRARTYLLKNDQIDQAHDIWNSLLASPYPVVVSIAQNMLIKLKHNRIERMFDQLQQLEQNIGKAISTLYISDKENIIEIEQAILKDAIFLRESGLFKESLLLLDFAVEAGLSSPWIEENRARAFVHLDRCFEAVAIWDKLSQLEDDGLKTVSIQMAELHRQKLSDLELDVLASSEVCFELKDRLDNAIALRKSGDLEASLEQLSACKNEGYHSPWISDNRARIYLLKNDQIDQAHDIWTSLLASPYPVVVSVAQNMLTKLKHNQIERMFDQLQQLEQKTGKALSTLHISDKENIIEIEQAILKDAIFLRESGLFEDSLLLLDFAEEAGLSSPWIDDNRARAFIALECFGEACQIWQILSNNENPQVRQSTEEMLNLYSKKANEQVAITEANKLINSSNTSIQSRTSAKQLLVEAILFDPENNRLKLMLDYVSFQDFTSAKDVQIEAELENHWHACAGMTTFLNTLLARHS